ncbi:MAG: hypothetical protein EA369_06305 [Bradymonadales bacterium]|nr:MAG: hypothetical protein EA369_06305 [Bradymonadales bacterium]
MSQNQRMDSFVDSVRDAMVRGFSQEDLFLLVLIMGACIGGGLLISWTYQKRYRIRRNVYYLWRRMRGRTQSESFRRDLQIPVLIVTAAAARPSHRSHTVDISRGGMYIKTPQPYPLSSSFQFRLLLDPEPPLEGIALVRWVQGEESPTHPKGMGVEFVDLSPRDKNRLRKIVKSRQKQKKKRPLNARGA